MHVTAASFRAANVAWALLLCFLARISHAQYYVPPVGAANFSQGYDGENCPSRCHGVGFANPPHGFCKLFGTGTDKIPLCECSDDWNGGAWDCSERQCPVGTPWFSMPTSNTEAHSGVAKCSNKGSCDYDTGRCQCGTGYEGHACQRMSCPGWDRETKTPCSGHGRCTTMAEAAMQRGHASASAATNLYGFYQGGRSAGYGGNAVQYRGWEKDMVTGCVCDPGWGGYDCSLKECPYGSDPHYRGNLEVQRIRTVVDKLREIQLVTLSASPMPGLDVDEVQTITIAGVAGSLPQGTFKLRFDSTGTDGKCKLCITSAVATTATITLSGSAANIAAEAAAVQGALEALSNIKTGGVTVAGSVANAGADYVFTVTFVGSDVGGDVSLLALNSLSGLTSTYNAGGTGVAQTKAGSEIQGGVVLKYNDATTVPTLASLVAGGDTTDSAALALEGDQFTASISYAASASTIATAIKSIIFPGVNSVEVAPVNAIVVNRVGTGGPGIAWSVTFADGVRARGNLAEMIASSNTLSMQAHNDLTGYTPTLSATVSTTQEGTFLGGSWKLRLSWQAEDGTVLTTPLVASSLSWNAADTDVAAAINALDATSLGVPGTGGYGIGAVTVTRARSSLIATSSEWSGEYEWLVTFSSCSENVPEMPVPTGELLTDGSLSGGGGNDPTGRAPRFTVTTVTEGGDGTGEVNEVQLIDCKCSGAACTSSASHYVRLAFVPLTNAQGRKGGAVVASSLADFTSATGGAFPSGLSPGVRSSTVLANGVELRYGPYGQWTEITAPIPHDATAAQVALALAALPSIPAVTVNFYDSESSSATAAKFCDADGVTTAITFTHNPGPQNPLFVHTPAADMKLPSYGAGTGANGLTATYFAIRSAASGAAPGNPADIPSSIVRGSFGGRARLGTRVLLPCSGRGTCDTATGMCTCHKMRSTGTGTSTTQIGVYGDSNNAGGYLSPGAPSLGDDGSANCGNPSVAAVNCLATEAGICNGQGTCSGAVGGFRCICNSGFTGPACEFARCPTTFVSTKSAATPSRAWFDVATSSTSSHVTGSVCSNRGYCSFTTVLSGVAAGAVSGFCQCVEGFRGPACELTICPEGGNFGATNAQAHADTCANGNECITMRDYGLNYRTTDQGEWLDPANSNNKIDYSASWDAVQIRGCACNKTRSFVGGGRGSSSPGVYAGWPSDFTSPAASNRASKDEKGGGSSFGSLTTATGWDCREYNCPGGHDPMDKALQATYANNMADNTKDIDGGKNKHPYEVQKIVCYLESGNVVAGFRNSSTRGFPAITYVINKDAPFKNVTGSLYTFERALNELANVTGDIKISTATPGSLLCGAGGKTTYITFRSLEGDLPLFRLTPTTSNCPTAPGGTAPCIFITEEQTGSIGKYPCSRRGKCVRENGLCSCQPQFLSSNGMFRPGNRGDCGHTDVLQGFNQDLATRPLKYTDHPETNIFGL